MVRKIACIMTIMLMACSFMVIGCDTVSAAEVPGPCVDVGIAGFWNSVTISGEFPSNYEAADIKGFHFYRGLDPGNMSLHYTMTLRVIPVFKVFMYQDTSILNGIKYYYSVAAFNDDGDGVRSKILNATCKGVPPAPQNLTGHGTFTTIELGWDPPLSDGGKPIVNYSVYRGYLGGDLSLIGNVTAPEYTDHNVESGDFYNYEVRAVNEYGVGKSSGAIFVDVPMPTISGTVLDASGVPVSNAKVELDGNATVVTTGTNGSFVLEALGGAHHLAIWVDDKVAYETDLSSPRAALELGTISLSITASPTSDHGPGPDQNWLLLIGGLAAAAGVVGAFLIVRRRR